MSRSNSDNIISPQAADLLISLRDGDAALLYLYFCRHGFRAPERASKDLFMPRQRLQEACERLEMQGLLIDAGDAGLLPGPKAEPDKQAVSSGTGSASPAGGDLPPYSALDVSARAGSDGDFSALLNEARLILGRPLSTPDLIKMLGIYDHFGLPAEVMMELMHFVADVYRERYQESRRPTVGAFEREARIWVEHQVSDFDAAERYIQQYRERRSMEGALKDAMQIVNRDFTETERRYLTQWLDWGFQPDAIALAYDITVTKVRKFSAQYMNRILQNWHEKGLHRVDEIREKDRPPQAAASSSASGKSGPIDPHLLDSISQTMSRKRMKKEEVQHGA